MRAGKTYHQREEDHRMAVHHNPWAGQKTEDQVVLDAGDQSQTHQEGDYHSRMQL